MKTIRYHKYIISSGIIISSMGSSCFAQEEGTQASQSHISLFSTLASGGVIGYLIIGFSLIAAAMIVDNFLRLKRSHILPDDIVNQLTTLMNKRDIENAEKLCRENNSFVAKIVQAGLAQHKSVLGFFEMSKAIQECSERIIAKYFRRLDYLAFIGSAAPMLGLLGTVTGMIKSFNQIALTEGSAKASQLAGGISEALVTTCLGLIVAIPTIFFVTYFKNRVEEFIAETEPIVDELMSSFKNE